jgi:hypothetical protein
MRAACLGETPAGFRQSAFAIGVHDRKVQEEVNRPRVPRRLDHLPVQVEAIGIEQAQPTAMLLPAHLRKDVLKEDLVAITGVDVDIGPIARQPLEVLDLVAIHIDQEELFEWRSHVERVTWASADHGSG